MESISEESKLLYDILKSETTEIYEAKWASYRARTTAAAAMASAAASSPPTSVLAVPRASSGAAAISTARPAVASVRAAAYTRAPAAAPLDSTPAPVLAPGASFFSLTLFAYLVEDADITNRAEIRLPPWPPAWSGGIQNIIRVGCQDMTFMPWTTLFPLLVESIKCIRGRFEIWLYCLSSQDAERLVFCSATCSISNMCITMDMMQISGTLQEMRAVGLEWNANFVVSNLVFGVQCT